MLEIKGADLVPVDFDPFVDTSNLTLPITPQQSEVWVESQMGPEASCAFNQCFVLHLKGPLSLASMQNALDQVVGQHAALRTCFDKEGREQRIVPSRQTKLAFEDVSGLHARQRQDAIERILDRETREPFDLANGPLLRAKVVSEAADLHRLILTVHHIVCDGWSSSVLFCDLAASYAADRFGLQARLAEPMSYQEYVTGVLGQSDAAADEAYWLERLAGEVPNLDLPLDHKRPASRSRNGARQTLRIEPDVYKQIKIVGASRGATLFHTLLAAFEVLMFRLSGQEDLVIGIPIAGQSELENSHLVAHCVATLPLRCRLHPQATFSQFLKHLRTTFLEGQAHPHVAFGSLLSKLTIERDISRPALISVVFNIDRLGAAFDFGDLSLERVETPKRFVTFDLNVNVVDSGHDLLIECDYNSDILEADTIRRWLGHMSTLLGAIVRDGGLDTRVGEICLLSAAEHDQIVRQWNATGADYPAASPFTRLFEARVKASPRSVAVSCDGKTLTYAELNARSNRLAHHLIANGAGREVIVGLCLDRSLDLVVALLAIQKSGAAYLPLDPGFPAERLAYMLTDSGASLLLAGPDAADELEVPPQVKRIELDRLPLDAYPTDDVLSVPGPNDPAYVIYTSGSTGRPKGVVVPHRALVNFLCSMQRQPGLTDADILAAVTTISFDIAGLELYLPLMVGARVELVPRETAADADLLAQLLDASGATVLQATPATWRMLIEGGWSGSDRLRALCGGEALPADLAKALLPCVRELWNLYGPTETTIWSSVEKIEPTDRAPSIGRPIANTQLYVVDKAGEPVSVGVAGEIWIGGDGVALGYHRRPELTAERFVHDHFRDRPGARLYRTGDLGRWLPDGRLQHLGRIDNQVKIRGFRIELGEIEAALDAHPMVRQSAAVAREIAPGDTRLVAYIVLDGAEDLTVSEVRRYLRTSLPDYMIPSFVMTLQSLPLTANGKLDRGALPNVLRSISDDVALSEPPAPGMEQLLADIWREALRVDKVNAGDKFFDLGGHSLLAIKVAVALQKQIGWRMDPRSLFFQTLRQVAAQAAAAARPTAANQIA